MSHAKEQLKGDDVEEVITLLKNEKIGIPVTELFKSTHDRDTWRGFWRMLASESSMTSFVSTTNMELLKKQSFRNDSVHEVKEIQENFPYLLRLLGQMDDSQTRNVKSVMEHICHEANKLLQQSPSVFPYGDPQEDSERDYFPGLPKVRERGAYKQDRNSQHKACRKLKKGHPYLGPGLFTVFCVHGKSKISFLGLNLFFLVSSAHFTVGPSAFLVANMCYALISICCST